MKMRSIWAFLTCWLLSSEAGKQLIVATSKPEEFSIQILKHFGLYDYFDFNPLVRSWIRKRSKKSDVIQYAWSKMGLQIWRIPS